MLIPLIWHSTDKGPYTQYGPFRALVFHHPTAPGYGWMVTRHALIGEGPTLHQGDFVAEVDHGAVGSELEGEEAVLRCLLRQDEDNS